MLRNQVFAAIGYAVIVFPLALIWHIVLFENAYHTFGYFNGEPNIPLGFATIALQGIVLAVVYPMFASNKQGFVRPVLYCGLMGTFYWTSHVLALVAKQNVPNAIGFVLMETIYLSLQFGAFALVLAFAFRTRN